MPAHRPTVGFPDQASKPPKETDKTLYAAIDLHSNNSVLCVLDESDRIVFSKRLSNDHAKIEQALRSCPGKIQGVAIEST